MKFSCEAAQPRLDAPLFVCLMHLLLLLLAFLKLVELPSVLLLHLIY